MTDRINLIGKFKIDNGLWLIIDKAIDFSVSEVLYSKETCETYVTCFNPETELTIDCGTKEIWKLTEYLADAVFELFIDIGYTADDIGLTPPQIGAKYFLVARCDILAEDELVE